MAFMSMDKKLLFDDADGVQKVKEIALLTNPQKLKMILDKFSWKIMVMLSENEMYPLEIARKLNVHEQKVYYHIRKLVRAGAVTVSKEEEKKGAIAKYYRPVSQAFGIEFSGGYATVTNPSSASVDRQVQTFFRGFVKKGGEFDAKIVVGSPIPHGPFKTSARDGHYAAHLTFFLGQFAKLPSDFAIKLDVDVKAEKEEKNNLILVGGPGTNVVTQEVNEHLPIRFSMQPSEQGFLLGGLVSNRTRRAYSADTAGLISKISNPWDPTKRIIVFAGNKAVGTKACVLAMTNFWKTTLKTYKGNDDFATVIQGLDLDSDGKVDSVEVLE